MAGVKRSISTRSTRLTAKASPFNPSVTLFEASDEATTEIQTQRRAKRIKIEAGDIVKDEEVEGEAVLASPSTLTAEASQVSSLPSDEKTTKTPRRSKRVKTEAGDIVKAEDVKEEADEAILASSSTSRKRKTVKSTSPRKPKAIQQSLDVPHPAPPRWQETYETIRKMRDRIEAPVDTMGCDTAKRGETDPKARRLSTLIALMLSSQTKDEVTDPAVSKLRATLGGSITLEALLEVEDSALSEAICKVGFWRRKTEYIKKAAEQLRDKFEGDVPKTVDELCSLPGVGPKMAFLTLQSAWNLNVGIGVDVHVHRITNRLGWHNPPTKTPEETRLNLQSWLPKELHPHINHMLVGFGQMICVPIGPKCESCDLSTAGLCPSARKVTKTTTSKARKKTVKAEATEEGLSPEAAPKIEILLEDEKLEVMESTETEEPPLVVKEEAW